MTPALSAVAALVSLAFAFMTHERWLVKRRPYELTWTIALGTFFVGALALAWGSAGGWGSFNFRLFYLFGAIVNVPLLAVGQVELISSKPWVRYLRPVVVGACVFAGGVLVATPLKAEIPSDRLPQGREVFGVLPRVLAAVGSAGGAFVVFAGAIFSLVALVAAKRRGQVAPTQRVVGTGLIALGTVVLSASGSLNKRFGEMTAFAITLTIGVIILFAGFLVSTLSFSRNANH
jgi:MFS family permease